MTDFSRDLVDAGLTRLERVHGALDPDGLTWRFAQHDLHPARQCALADGERRRGRTVYRSGDFGYGLPDGLLERLRRLGPCDQVAIVDHHGRNAAYPRSLPFFFGVAHFGGEMP